MRKYISIFTFVLLAVSSTAPNLSAETLDLDAISLQLSMELRQELNTMNYDNRSVLLLRDNDELSSSTQVCTKTLDDLNKTSAWC